MRSKIIIAALGALTAAALALGLGGAAHASATHYAGNPVHVVAAGSGTHYAG